MSTRRSVVTVRLSQVPDDGLVRWVAAAPPESRSSFAGSGLPFASAEQAFYDTPNRGTSRVDAATGEFRASILPVNSYYVGLGTVEVPPTLHMAYASGGRQVREARKLAQHAVPYRSLTYPAGRTGPGFYAPPTQLARPQEAILRASAFDAAQEPAEDFWSGRPPR